MTTRRNEAIKVSEDSEIIEEKESDSPVSMVRLDGIGINDNRELVKTHWFDNFTLDLDLYGDIELTREEAISLRRSISKLKHGFAAVVPLKCSGDLCPFRVGCPLYAIGKAPVGRPCPLEGELFFISLSKYAEEYEVEDKDFIDQALIKELAELDVYEYRITQNLSQAENATLIEENVVAYDPTEGNPVVQKQISQAMELKFKIKKERMKLHEQLVGTRKEKYKREAALKRHDEPDASKLLSDLRDKFGVIKLTDKPGVVIDVTTKDDIS